MLTKTSEIAIQTLVWLARRRGLTPANPKEIAGLLHASPSYVAKVTGTLVKIGLLRAHRGVRGGVLLGRAPDAISLLEVIEACQGRILGDYCAGQTTADMVCGYHAAMLELHDGVVSVLGRWNIADLVRRPLPAIASLVPSCRMAVACNGGCEATTSYGIDRGDGTDRLRVRGARKRAVPR